MSDAALLLVDSVIQTDDRTAAMATRCGGR